VAAHRVLISAHRCGFTELGEVGGTEDPVAGIAHSAAVGADYCEFDVRRCADGVFVIAHDPDVGDDPIRTLDWPAVHSRAPEVLRLDELLAALAETDMGAHVDV
jgi:glycerophosphoryl diester phosphodiesterase